MSLLNWQLSEDGVVVLTDTLALDAEDHRPRSMTTKAFAAPHINALICGTGLALLITRFYMRVVESMVVRDVTHLNDFATETLLGLWSDLGPIPDGSTATIYTFGWNEEEERYVGFAYRSEKQFASKQLPYAFGIKPEPNDLSVLNEIVDFASLAALADIQKAEDRVRSRIERVGIGGDLLLYMMSNSEQSRPALQIVRVKRFDDFEADWQLLLAKLPQNTSHPLSQMLLAEDP